MREVERYVFVATNIKLAVLEGGAGGILGCGEDARRKGRTHRSDDVRPSAEVGMFRKVVEQQPAGICLSAARPEIFPRGD